MIGPKWADLVVHDHDRAMMTVAVIKRMIEVLMLAMVMAVPRMVVSSYSALQIPFP
jgi:hypothetical protein